MSIVLDIINRLVDEYKLEYREYIADKGAMSMSDGSEIIEVKDGAYMCEIKMPMGSKYTGVWFRSGEIFTEEEKDRARMSLVFIICSMFLNKKIHGYA